MRRLPVAVTAAAALTASACGRAASDAAGPSTPVVRVGAAAVIPVTSSADDGPGSLRASLALASESGPGTRIELADGLPAITLAAPLVYSGAQLLDMDGNGGVVIGPPCAGCDALVVSGGADVALTRLTVRDAGGSGVSVRVPGGATGTVDVSLREVTLLDNGLHGLLVDDQAPGDTPGPDDPVPFGFDSDAGITLDMTSSLVQGNGFKGVNDFDGVRIDEGGLGGIQARIRNTRVLGNGADGVELDERGEGDARLVAERSHFDGNGNNNAEDPDDAIDVDEAGEGSIVLHFARLTGNGNFDEGFDFTEADAGDLVLEATRVDAIGNADEGVKLEEGGAGSIRARLTRVRAASTRGADGIQLEEIDEGDLVAAFTRVAVTDNLEKGINVEEGGDGDLRATIVGSTVARNGEAGVAAEQGGAGAGTLEVAGTRIVDNVDGALDLSGVTVREVPSGAPAASGLIVLDPTTTMSITGLDGALLRFRLIDAPDDGAWSLRIDWGDGEVDTPPVTRTGVVSLLRTKALAAPGIYTVALTPTDRNGVSGATATTSLIVP